MESVRFLRARQIITVSLLTWLTLALFACSTASTTDTPLPTGTSAPVSTATSTLTATSLPASTFTPTATPISLPLTQAGRVVRSESFDSLSTLNFAMYGIGQYDTVDGHLVLTEKFSSEATADGEAAGRSIFSPQPGNTSVFLFKAEEGNYFGYHFEIYEKIDEGEQYTGINLQQQGYGVQLNFWKGKPGVQELLASLPVTKFRYDTWYYYALQVQPDGLVTAQIWERDQPTNVIFNESRQMDAEWAKPGFTFVITSYQGTMEIDEYQEIQLTE